MSNSRFVGMTCQAMNLRGPCGSLRTSSQTSSYAWPIETAWRQTNLIKL